MAELNDAKARFKEEDIKYSLIAEEVYFDSTKKL